MSFIFNLFHVNYIKFYRAFTQNQLEGPLPKELGNLKNLERLLLDQNQLEGSIPKELGNLTNLERLSVSENRLSGTIPKEIGDIHTLTELILDQNQLEGSLPEELGNLRNLETLTLSVNNFNGTIPQIFGNFKKLTDLNLLGSSMEGPIPSTLSLLSNLTALRISDLMGPNMPFPDLKNLTKLRRLILKNCSLSGSIPDYIGQNMSDLNTLDLSFNNLTGEIPETLKILGTGKQKHVFLTSNSLSRVNWSWITNGERNWDLSYNNFTERPPLIDCSFMNLNSVSSYSSFEKESWCLTKNLPCPITPNHKSLFINCGGDNLNHNGHEYEQDKRPEGISNFVSMNLKWGYSSTGVYMGDEDNKTPDFLATNNFSLKTDAEIYDTARLAPLSLKYYGLCLEKGKYKVQLHFAEIMYSDDQAYSSLGKRIFNVKIQGIVVLKDYNIVERSGGVGKSVTETFDATVSGSTLEIHLYWVGRGIAKFPHVGLYGPLISAITITKIIVILVLLVLWMTGYLGGNQHENHDVSGIPLQIGRFTLSQMRAATDNFNPVNKIGEGGFGPVYRGVLSDGSLIAVKQRSSRSQQGNREFISEVGIMSGLEHPNLVRLYGCCIEGDQLLLVYEYMENNSLARALFGNKENPNGLDWPTRKKICLGVAKGLAYLHEESRLTIIHRDVKATNILLDRYLNAKISDFGMAKLDERGDSHIGTQVAGTEGYMAPEYKMGGQLTVKADVYSFGIVALEIVMGKSNSSFAPSYQFQNLLDWVRNLKQEGNLMELVDSRLGSDYDQEEVMVAIHVALRCTHVSAANRPSMASVVSMLEGRVAAQELISGTASGVSMLEGMVAAQELITGPTVSNDDHEALRNTFQHMVEGNVSESEISI
nr:probable LRR receptor-like serine/threonine-protein kinase At1g53440 isoform X2 [Ziziphus jujuba var. spinosa]